MTSPIVVCPFDEDLLGKMQRTDVAIKTNDHRLIPDIQKSVARRNVLHRILLDTDQLLSSVPLQEQWAGIPLTIYAPEFGSFKDLLRMLPLLRKLDIEVFLSPQVKRNFLVLQILSSLNVRCGLQPFSGSVDWELLNDLMVYAVYSKAAHAPIEPFHYAVTHYLPHRSLDFNFVYFNDPQQFIHLTPDQDIALTAEDLARGNFVAKGLDEVRRLDQNPLYKKSLVSWQRFFLQPEGCAYCSAWRICLGKFQETAKLNPGCRPFFNDLMDASDFWSEKNGRPHI